VRPESPEAWRRLDQALVDQVQDEGLVGAAGLVRVEELFRRGQLHHLARKRCTVMQPVA